MAHKQSDDEIAYAVTMTNSLELHDISFAVYEMVLVILKYDNVVKHMQQEDLQLVKREF